MWLLVIAWLAFRLLEQFCYSSRGLVVAHFWAGSLGYSRLVIGPMATCHLSLAFRMLAPVMLGCRLPDREAPGRYWRSGRWHFSC